MIVAKPGIKSFKELKGKKVGLELTLVEHLLLLKALEKFGMKTGDVKLVNFPTNETRAGAGLRGGRRDRPPGSRSPGRRRKAVRRVEADLHQRRRARA